MTLSGRLAGFGLDGAGRQSAGDGFSNRPYALAAHDRIMAKAPRRVESLCGALAAMLPLAA
ncbi:MAG TPA: hypothetical protein VHM92_11730 [Allosphingosinicella sp.]|nr:hypothetical protein [Allosphingosinicella sp.]